MPEFSDSTAEVRQDDEREKKKTPLARMGLVERVIVQKRGNTDTLANIYICSRNFTGNKARKVGHVGTMYYIRKAVPVCALS